MIFPEIDNTTFSLVILLILQLSFLMFGVIFKKLMIINVFISLFCFRILVWKGNYEMDTTLIITLTTLFITFSTALFTYLQVFGAIKKDSEKLNEIKENTSFVNLIDMNTKEIKSLTSSTPQISSTTTEIKKILNEGSDSIVYKLNDLYNNHKNTISNQEISSKLINQNVSVVNTILNELVNKIVFLDNHNKELENKIKILNEKIIILNQELEKSNLKQELNQDYEPNI